MPIVRRLIVMQLSPVVLEVSALPENEPARVGQVTGTRTYVTVV